MQYKLSPRPSTVIRVNDGAYLSADNPEYVRWLADGNTPLAADPPAPLDPVWVSDQTVLANLANQYTVLKSGIDTINQHMDQILNGPAVPTAAQAGTALKLIAQDIKTTMTGLGMLIDDMAIIVRRQ